MDGKNRPLFPVQELELRFHCAASGYIAKVSILRQVCIVYRARKAPFPPDLPFPVQEHYGGSPCVIGQNITAVPLHHRARQGSCRKEAHLSIFVIKGDTLCSGCHQSAVQFSQCSRRSVHRNLDLFRPIGEKPVHPVPIPTAIHHKKGQYQRQGRQHCHKN